MRKIIVAITAAFTFLAAHYSFSQQLPVPAQENIYQNYLVNPGFENGKYGWTASGGATAAANATAKGEGSYGYDWDSNSASQTLISNSITIPAGLYGRNGSAYCLIKTPSGTATHTLVVDDGTTNLVSAVTVASSASFARTSTNFIFPSSGSVRLKLTSVASNEPEVYIDSCYLGEASNLQQISQTQFVGSASIANTSSCDLSRTSTSLGGFNTAAACPGPTVEYNPGPGTIQTTDADLVRFTVNNLPPGTYMVTMNAMGYTSSAGSYYCFAINDGTNTRGSTCASNLAGGESPFAISAPFTYTTTQNVTFELYGSNSAGAIHIDNTTGAGGARFRIERYPSTSDQAYRPDQAPANWSGYHDSTCSFTRANAAFGEFTADATCAFTERTNRNFGTVSSATSAGNNLPGIVFTPPRVGRYYVCASTGVSVAGTNQNWSLEMVDGSSNVIAASSGASGLGSATPGVPITLCGIYNASSVSSTTVKLFGAGSGANTITATLQGGVGNAVEWSIIQLDAALATPILVNSVVSDSSGVEKIARVKYYTTAYGTVCSGDPCAVSSSVTGLTVTWNATGDYTVNFPAGTFSAAPTCNAMAGNSSNGIAVSPTFASVSSTAFRFTTKNSNTGSALNTSGDMICVGPK